MDMLRENIKLNHIKCSFKTREGRSVEKKKQRTDAIDTKQI